MVNLIYHYTSMECFHSMLETFEKEGSQEFELWASSIFYMNDPREFYHGYEMLMNHHLPKIEKEMTLKPELRVSRIWNVDGTREKETGFKRTFINSLMKNNQTPFIISYSRLQDNAALWNKYGDKGRGVCLVFKEYESEFISANLPKDADVKIKDMMRVYDVSYDGSLDESCIKVLKNTYEKFYKKAKHITNDMQLFELKLNYLVSFVIVFAPYIKTKSFSFEHEARLIKLIQDNDQISFRCAKDGTLIPFVKERVPVSNFIGVYVGPASCVELNTKALENRFHNNKALYDKRVIVSDLSPEFF